MYFIYLFIYFCAATKSYLIALARIVCKIYVQTNQRGVVLRENKVVNETEPRVLAY